MTYDDNPRKVYGKVKIVYADGEISKELNVETSGNGDVSNPNQIYMGYISPQIKACTMDGNSYMGQGFQMNGHGLVCGWWSDVHSDIEGSFIQPPYISLSFMARPVYKWTVIGDNKLGQYPVDFDVTLYSYTSIPHVEEIRGNDKVEINIEFGLAFEDITRIRLDIYKWNKPNAKAKIIQFFDILEEEYAGADLKSFEVLEELTKDFNGIDYGITADTASFFIYNRERKFDRGYLKNMLLLGRKVIPYIGIKTSGDEIEYTKLGTFYSNEWRSPQSDQWITLKCSDKLLKLQDITYTGYPYTENVSLYDLAEDVLIKAGFSASDYFIDEELHNDIIPCGFMKKSSAWEALNDICYAGLCYVYIDRNDILRIVKDRVDGGNLSITPDKIFSFDKHVRNTDFSNYVEINYSNIYVGLEIVKVFENTLTIDGNSSIIMSIDYSDNITDALLTITPQSDAEVVSFVSGIDAGKFELRNPFSFPVTVTVSIEGFKVEINSQTAIVQDEESVKRWGRQQVVFQGSDLIQSYEKAAQIGNTILNKMKMGSGTLQFSWRGDPALNLQDSFTAIDRYGDSARYVCGYNRFSYDGGLRQETKGRLITDGDME
jgi:hypothetical protein